MHIERRLSWLLMGEVEIKANNAIPVRFTIQQCNCVSVVLITSVNQRYADYADFLLCQLGLVLRLGSV